MQLFDKTMKQQIKGPCLHPIILYTVPAINESNQVLPSTSLYHTIFINNIIPIQFLLKNYNGTEHLTSKHH